MDITILPRLLSGEITIIPSKSQAHRLLICSAFANGQTYLACPETNQDIEATAECLRSLGADIFFDGSGYHVSPIIRIPESAELNCCESGSTLRFLLPITGALGVDAIFRMEGRLPVRPLSPLWEEMERMGCTLSRPTADTIRCLGRLTAGCYRIDGSVSSQYITGLLFALSLIPGESHLEITGKTESRPYIEMTRQAMALFQAPRYHSPGTITVEGDWSNGAFFLTAQKLGSPLTLLGLEETSCQGDRAIVQILDQLDEGSVTVSAADIPDLVPVLAVFAACRHGAVFTDIRRLRLKESDRVASTLALIQNLGGRAEAAQDSLRVYGTGLTGGTVDSANDHRIAMAAAIAATACKKEVTILGAQCVRKSYPKFWDEYARSGGIYELHLR